MKQITTLLILAIFFSSCTKDQGAKNTMPTKLSVNIPDNLSTAAASRSVQSTNLMDGADTYEMIRAFIATAEGAAEVVESITTSLHEHKIDQVMDFPFVGDDGRNKRMMVEEDKDYKGTTWDLKLTATDKALNDTAIQVFWNKGEAAGIAILHPYHMNREDNGDVNAVYKIDYSELESAYDARMIVEVSVTGNDDEWSLNKIKLFAAKIGDEFVLYGNSNHPNVGSVFSSYTEGANYVFTAKSNETDDIAVAEIALPPSTLTHTDNILKTYSVEDVLKDEVVKQLHDGGEIDTTTFTEADWIAYHENLDAQIINLGAPAYFNEDGFISAGASLPTGFTEVFVDMSDLSPYIPIDIKNLEIKFE